MYTGIITINWSIAIGLDMKIKRKERQGKGENKQGGKKGEGEMSGKEKKKENSCDR